MTDGHHKGMLDIGGAAPFTLNPYPANVQNKLNS
jgi:hypothetical protein